MTSQLSSAATSFPFALDEMLPSWTHDWDRCRPLTVAGAMSGTSMDGIDVACLSVVPTGEDLRPLHYEVLAARSISYSSTLRQQLLDVADGAPLTMSELSQLDTAIASAFATAISEVCHSEIRHSVDSSAANTKLGCDLIGSHGQTVFHLAPVSGSIGHSIQLGRGELIAALTDTPTVSNFRAADIAHNGHGAPLVPRVDALLLQDANQHRCIQNIGGIGNVTYLPALLAGGQIVGWDTGPGNVLIDLAAVRLSQGKLTFDRDGAWAAQGTANVGLVKQWLQTDFFALQPPKSTGRELFSPTYLERCMRDCEALALSSADVMATLTEFTAASIADSYSRFLPVRPDCVAICGGGASNRHLMERLQAHFDESSVLSTAALGLDPEFKEAIAFAILAYLRVFNLPGNLPSVTGASDWCLLGDIHTGQMYRTTAQ